MHIEFIEIQNFRKLRSCRVEFAEKTTVFVGANNSGKTSAMDALILFLLEKKFITTDFTLSNWNEIDKIGESWLKDNNKLTPDLSITPWLNYLPSIDVWIKVAKNEIHYVNHIIPTLDWDGGSLGIRLRFEPNDIEALYKDFLFLVKSAKETIDTFNKAEKNTSLKLWPKTIRDFLDKRLGTHFTVRSYILSRNA